MKRLSILLLFSVATLFAQQPGEQPVTIPIQTPPELGYGQTFSQDLGIAPAQIQTSPGGYSWDGIYTLTFSIINTAPSGKYPGLLNVEIDFGTQRLCEGYWWGLRSFVQIPMVCTGPAYIVNGNSLPSGGQPQGTSNLKVTWTVDWGNGNSWPIKFYDAALTFTPTQ